MIGFRHISSILALTCQPVVIVLFGAAMLSACSTSSARQALPTSLFGSSGKSTQPLLAELRGGIISRAGVQLSRRDYSRAVEAEYRALETSPAGQSVEWGDGSLRGQVKANAPYQVGNQNCRQYSHTITIDGREQRARGAACRSANGAWAPLI